MDRNLDKIEKWTQKQFEVSEPFFTYARKRLKEMGEVEEGGGKGGGGFLALLLAPLLAALAGIAAKLAKIPLIGPILGKLARMLGIPMVARSVAATAGRGARGAAASVPPALPAPKKVAPKWGKAVEGVRGNRAARVGRVAMRNAGRAMRPAGAALATGGKAVGSVLKRVPVIGSLLGLGLGLLGSSAIEKDETKNREEKNAAQGKNWGGVAGGLGGAAAGAALGTVILPGIGTVIGGVLGAVLGEWLGGNLGEAIGERFSGWMNTLTPYWSGLVAVGHMMFDGIAAAWDAVVTPVGKVLSDVGTSIKEAWDGFIELAKTGFDKFTSAIAAIYEGLKNIPGIGKAIRAAEAAAAKIKDVAVSAAPAVAKAAKAVMEATPAGVALKAGEWALGKVSAAFESGKNGAGTVSTGNGDAGGASYGTHQLSSKAGTLQKFLKQSGYDSQFAGLKPGSDEFNAKWREIARTDPKFGDAQHGFIKATHYDPQMAKLAKAGIDLSGRGDAVQESVFSTSVQFGGDTSLIQKALRGQDVSKLSDAQIVTAIQNYKIANNDALFKSSDAKVRKGTLARAHNEKAELLGLAAAPTVVAPQSPALVAPAAPVSATLKAPAPPPPTVSPAIPDAPQVQVPLGSGPAAKPLVVQMPQPDAGQDVRDRGIAHIATGGYARA